jgi:glutamate dehydrogenase
VSAQARCVKIRIHADESSPEPPQIDPNHLAEQWERRFVALLRRVAADAFPAARYRAAFPEAYRALTPPALAVRDALKLEQVRESSEDALELWRPRCGEAAGRCLLRFYSPRERYLDELLPLLEKLGLRVADQMRFPLDVEGRRIFLTSFSVEAASTRTGPLMTRKRALLEALHALLAQRVENDALNGLLPITALSWREIDVFRGYRNYYFQLGARIPPQRFHQALLNNPKIAQLLYRYFATRFRPDPALGDAQRREEEALPDLRLELTAMLGEVSDAVEDRILRDLFNLIDATMRTSYFQRRDAEEYFFAFKIASLGVLNMPAPKPLYEIYVHAAHMEGIHLRGAKIARGGIRWSERPDDLRSEILGLMHTQTVKNAQIVPHGAKGGFVVKALPSESRVAEAGQRAYTALIRGLLDLTDNIVAGNIERPPGLVTYDDDDPYLVVAADKGTAGMSDAANAIARDYGFWLQDAFASGGSRGYDHKRLGITARGAFECVRRHFLELGRDIDQESFTVVGIGSMDGDVFGNGMVLSQRIRLRAAFDARHIFLDPDPDPASGFAERRRLFELPGSSWDDYDRGLISAGGGVFARDAKDIPLSRATRDWLGVRFASIDGEGLIRLLLAAPVDLLWLGGIGTYVKASDEANEAVGDRANDTVRVDASQLRARVVGEGANLGFTQKARIEYALGGGKINTDAVDNSAGVDLSDHEVNLKILLALTHRHGRWSSQEQRDGLLAELTGEICAAVIAHNREQSLCISLDELRCAQDAEPFLETADRLESAGLLERAVEYFPTRKEVLARPKASLTRPELAVLMLHSKLALKRALLEQPDFLRSVELFPWLQGYFPATLAKSCREHLAEHPLAREITATMLVNAVVNRGGSAFLVLAREPEPKLLAEAVGAYLFFDAVLQGKSPCPQAADASADCYASLLRQETALADACHWALDCGRRFLPEPSLVARWRDMWLEYAGNRSPMPAERFGVFVALADLAERSGMAVGTVAGVYDAVDTLLGIGDVERRVAQMTHRDYWGRRLQQQIGARLRFNLACLTGALLAEPALDARELLSRQDGGRRLSGYVQLLREIQQTSSTSLVPYAALAGELEGLVDALLPAAPARLAGTQ